MPKRTDIKTILLIGSGPIIIGQACEFDYSGTQAVKTLKELGYRVVLINSNPATIMTDPEFADRTYIEPIKEEIISKIIKDENVDAVLPTMGGQTALNVAMSMYEKGMLEGVEFLGADPQAINKGEDRHLFNEAMTKIGMDLPRSKNAYSVEEALEVAKEIGFPVISRASFTLAGGGSGVAYNMEEFEKLAQEGISASPINEIEIMESMLGWKEYEMEVIRDKADNCIIVCSIENFDPMGVHTGDSITVAPALTLTDKEYQRMRDASFAILREIGVDTGGSNVQFSIDPKTGRMIVIEMNPRVSRSSALASKATGYPIAKVATLLAVGFTLDEITNDITGTPAAFEPVIDYVVTKIPRFTFEKFPEAQSTLSTSMKSVGEVMAIGRTFKESIQKALCSLETGLCGFDDIDADDEFIKHEIRRPNSDRILYVAEGFRRGMTIDEMFNTCAIDPWFLYQMQEMIETEGTVSDKILFDAELMRSVKVDGFSDKRISQLILKNSGENVSEDLVYEARKKLGVSLEYNEVDTCAAEFEALTPYLYSTTNITKLPNVTTRKSDKKKVLILGGGPNRIGQGIEFDYCCVHAAFALKEMDVETIMYNCNPETVSTDYDTSDVLYFEPIDFEHVREVIENENPDGIIVHFGGQTPLKLADSLTKIGAKIIGTPSAV
ncbi:carbamoyl-phosphate synthase large subunit, partial [Sulfurimonas sp.]|uniref:carbamoyl-phosphate synthase large subunit n=1 Tax=Sulfurimonas sp. TaxID=2022749 RepID=UPI00262AE4E8